MWTTIIASLLSLVSPLVTWFIGKFITDEANKQAYLAQFQAFISAHSGDGSKDVNEEQSYDAQLNQLENQTPTSQASNQQNTPKQ